MSISAAAIAKALGAHELSTGGWSAKCVAHDDTSPSLSIGEGEKGRPVVHCHAGCSQEAVLDGLKARGLWDDEQSRDIPLAHGQLGPYAKHWDYFDSNGKHVLRVCRWTRTDGGKEIRPLSQQADGWRWEQIKERRPLYQLTDLLRRPQCRVLLVEGEKTCDAAAGIFQNMACTTWPGGAKAAPKTDWEPLRKRDVTLLADNDAPGAAAMDQVMDILRSQGCTVRRTDLSSLGRLPDGWDCADAVADKSFDLQKFWELVEHAPIVTGKAHSLSLRQAGEIVSNPIPSAWLLRPYLEQMVLALIFGELGTLKSFVTLDMLLAIAAGKPWGGSVFRPKPQATVYVSAEGKGLAKRLQAWSIQHSVDLQKIPFYAVEHALDLSNSQGILELVTAIEALGIRPAVIGIDTLSRNSGPLDENSSADMGGFINALDQHLRQRLRCSVLLVHHVGHNSKDRARGSYSLMSSTDAFYRCERPDPGELTVKMTTGRLKDSESPDPIFLKAHVVHLGTKDEDGQPETSLVLLPTDDRPTEIKKRPSGKQQVAFLKLLEDEHRAGSHSWPISELRKLARERCNMGKTTAQSVVAGLSSAGFLKPTIGGLALTDPPEATH